MAEIKEKIGGFRFVDAGVGTYAINMSLGNNELSSRPLECAFTPNNQHINI